MILSSARGRRPEPSFGQPLTSADAIEAAAAAGDVVSINLGPAAVVVATISGN